MKTNREILHEALLKIWAGDWYGQSGICGAVFMHTQANNHTMWRSYQAALQALIIKWLEDKRYKHPDNVSVMYPVAGEEEYGNDLPMKERYAHPRRVQLLNYMIRATAPRKSKRK